MLRAQIDAGTDLIEQKEDAPDESEDTSEDSYQTLDQLRKSLRKDRKESEKEQDKIITSGQSIHIKVINASS